MKKLFATLLLLTATAAVPARAGLYYNLQQYTSSAALNLGGLFTVGLTTSPSLAGIRLDGVYGLKVSSLDITNDGNGTRTLTVKSNNSSAIIQTDGGSAGDVSEFLFKSAGVGRFFAGTGINVNRSGTLFELGAFGQNPSITMQNGGTIGVGIGVPAARNAQATLDVEGNAQFGTTVKSTFTATGSLNLALAARELIQSNAYTTLGKISESNLTMGDISGITGYTTQISLGYYAPGNTYMPASIAAVGHSQSAQTTQDLVFATRILTTDSAPLERVRILDSGNVGIGTAAPTDVASVAGWINTTQGIKINTAQGVTATCAGGQFLSGATWTGGIPTSGSCSSAGAGDMATTGTNNVTGTIDMQASSTLQVDQVVTFSSWSITMGATTPACKGLYCITISTNEGAAISSVTLAGFTSTDSWKVHWRFHAVGEFGRSNFPGIRINGDTGSNYVQSGQIIFNGAISGSGSTVAGARCSLWSEAAPLVAGDYADLYLTLSTDPDDATKLLIKSEGVWISPSAGVYTTLATCQYSGARRLSEILLFHGDNSNVTGATWRGKVDVMRAGSN